MSVTACAGLLNVQFLHCLEQSSETGRTGGHNLYAVIKTGGKQYKVAAGDEIFVEKLEGEAGEKITFDEVLAVADENGMKAGADLKATVEGEIVKQGKNKKVVVLKYKAKKGYRRKNGHRQPYTRVRITAVNA